MTTRHRAREARSTLVEADDNPGETTVTPRTDDTETCNEIGLEAEQLLRQQRSSRSESAGCVAWFDRVARRMVCAP
jgi:hypothetical protein